MSAPYFDKSEMSNTLLSTLANYEKPICPDLVIKTASDTIECHKHLLCMQSDYFVKALTGEFMEGGTNELALKNDDPGALRSLVEFCYRLEYNNIPPKGRLQHHVKVFAAAEKYLLEPLSFLAVDNFIAALPNEPFEHFCEAIRIAYAETSDPKRLLRKAIVDFILIKPHLYRDEPDFVKLMETIPSFGSDLACGVVDKTRPEAQVGLEARWKKYTCPGGCGGTAMLFIPNNGVMFTHSCFTGGDNSATLTGEKWQEHAVPKDT